LAYGAELEYRCTLIKSIIVMVKRDIMIMKDNK